MKIKKIIKILLIISLIFTINTQRIIADEPTTTVSTEKMDCDDLFGDKNDPNSLRYTIDEIMGYGRIIVPLIVIGYGLVDMGKAVIASKEDDMKKAQKTFVKRCVIGVAFFFLPVIVNLILSMTELIWGYSACGI